ncbi:MAG: homoserine dehydrogenase [Chloroflexota bacterium]
MAPGVAVGMLGLGVIGGGVLQALTTKAELIAARCGQPVHLKKALVRDVGKSRGLAVPSGLLTTDPEEVLADPSIGVVVEVLGGERPAFDYAKRALAEGKHLVTANKEMMAKYGPELLSLAGERGREVCFEASVGGGIPIIAALRRSLAANEIVGVQGIVNGTTNYILTEMAEQGRDFALALREAQELGYAEPDPTNDVEGYDSRYKLVILCALAFGAWPRVEAIPCEGIANLSPTDFRLASDMGYVIKLLAVGRRTAAGLEAHVGPTLVPAGGMLGGVKGVFNAVQVQGDMVGDMLFYGRGAGPAPTASAVLADLIGVIRGETSPVSPAGAQAALAPAAEVAGRFYLRLETEDRTAAEAAVEHLAGLGVDVAVRRSADGNLAFLTGQAKQAAVQRGARDLASLPQIRRVATLLNVID